MKTVVAITAVLMIGTALITLWGGAMSIHLLLNRGLEELASSRAPVVASTNMLLLAMLLATPFLLVKGRGRLLIIAATGLALTIPVSPDPALPPLMWLATKFAGFLLLAAVVSLLSSRAAAMWFHPPAAPSIPGPHEKRPAGVIMAFVLLVLATIGHTGQIFVNMLLYRDEIEIDFYLLHNFAFYIGVSLLLVAPFLPAGRDWARLAAFGLGCAIAAEFIVTAGFLPGSLLLAREEDLPLLATEVSVLLGTSVLAFIAALLLCQRNTNHWFARRRALRAGHGDIVSHAAPDTQQAQPWNPTGR